MHVGRGALKIGATTRVIERGDGEGSAILFVSIVDRLSAYQSSAALTGNGDRAALILQNNAVYSDGE